MTDKHLTTAELLVQRLVHLLGKDVVSLPAPGHAPVAPFPSLRTHRLFLPEPFGAVLQA